MVKLVWFGGKGDINYTKLDWFGEKYEEYMRKKIGELVCVYYDSIGKNTLLPNMTLSSACIHFLLDLKKEGHSIFKMNMLLFVELKRACNMGERQYAHSIVKNIIILTRIV